MENLFNADIDNNSKNIISIDLSHFDSSLVTNIDKLFSGCQELLALDLSNFISENIESSNDTFNNIKKLKFINLSYIPGLNNINTSELSNLNLTIAKVI